MAFRRKSPMPAELSAALLPDETVLANVKLADGGWLAATRYGLWLVPDEGPPHRWSWPLVSKVSWERPMLSVTVADVVGRLGDADIIVDRPPVVFEVAGASKLTDVVHQRVRSGIVSSVHHETRAGGCWLVLRRVPGRDGLIAQLRADRGTRIDEADDELVELIRRALAEVGPAS
jgi:hypothetical protein